jgi:GNAT superfamily N-acetyltransferase
MLKTNKCLYREAHVADIENMSIVRLSVKENVLSNPNLVSYNDYVEYLTMRGKGWVCETISGQIVGFAIVDLQKNSIWALFIMPGFEGFGIGKKLQQLMLDCYFENSKEKLWLETAADTRAEQFYKKTGWKEIHRQKRIPSNPNFPVWTEIKFELTFEAWKQRFRSDVL